MNREALEKAIEKSRKSMEKAAAELDFIEAARFRDEMADLQNLLRRKSIVHQQKDLLELIHILINDFRSINYSTYFAIAIEDVNPGDSIPIRFINPGYPLSALFHNIKIPQRFSGFLDFWTYSSHFRSNIIKLQKRKEFFC